MNQTLALHANVMDRGGEPLHGGDVSARITAPSGKAEMVRFTSAGDEWGEFTGRFTAEEPGRHEVTLFCKQTGRDARDDRSSCRASRPSGSAARPGRRCWRRSPA